MATKISGVDTCTVVDYQNNFLSYGARLAYALLARGAVL